MFEVGQELKAINDGGFHPKSDLPPLVMGATYICAVCEPGWKFETCTECMDPAADGVGVEGLKHDNFIYCSCSFRPVTRTRDTLSIESFMTIKTGQPEGPRRVVGPVRKREEVK